MASQQKHNDVTNTVAGIVIAVLILLFFIVVAVGTSKNELTSEKIIKQKEPPVEKQTQKEITTETLRTVRKTAEQEDRKMDDFEEETDNLQVMLEGLVE